MNPLRATASAPNFYRFAHKEIVKHAAAYVYTVRSGRLRSFVQYVQISAINKETVPLAAGGLFEDTEVDHVTQRLRDRWSGDTNPLRRRRNRNDGVSLHVLEDAQHGGGGSAECLDLLLIAVE